MGLNLLSNQQSDTGAASKKKDTSPSTAAFRIPEEETPIPKLADTRVGTGQAPITKQGVGTGQAKEVKKTTGAPPPVKPPVPSPVSPRKHTPTFTHPEDLIKGFGVDMLGGGGAHVAAPPSLQRAFAIVIGASVAAFLVLAGWFWFLTEESATITQRIGEADAALAVDRAYLTSVAESRVAMETRLKNIDTARALLSRHLYWTRFFKFLESVTIPDVYYTNLSVDPSGPVRLAAIGRNFSAVARQLLVFEESDDVQSVRMSKAAVEIAGPLPGVAFDLEITVKPNVLFTE